MKKVISKKLIIILGIEMYNPFHKTMEKSFKGEKLARPTLQVAEKDSTKTQNHS
jgi:hypothetical protein